MTAYIYGPDGTLTRLPLTTGTHTIPPSGTPTITGPATTTHRAMTVEDMRDLMRRMQSTSTVKGSVLFSSVKDADWLKDATDPTQRIAVQIAPQGQKASVLALPSGTVFNLSPDDAVTMANQLLDAAATARDNIHEAKDAG